MIWRYYHRLFSGTGFYNTGLIIWTTMLLLYWPLEVNSQSGQKIVSLNGYVSFTESATDMHVAGEKVMWESLLHNRLNFYLYPSDALTFSVQVRNRLITGDQLSRFGETYRQSLEGDMGWADMSWNLINADHFVMNSAIDRLWLKYTYKKMEITAGRQRINWGQTFVWNPNDWFNNFSFFDVDYIERPGSDALNLKYYTGVLSSVEGVLKVDSSGKYTAAGLFRTNIRQVDIQFLGGIISEQDLAIGAGWAGGIGNAGIRGEMSYFRSKYHFADTTGLFFISLAFDYTFTNTLALELEVLYSQMPEGYGGKSFIEFYSRPLSVKDISFTPYNLFMQASYSFTPLINGSLATMVFPKINGYFIGPTLSVSLLNNLDLTLFMQYFSGKFPDLEGMIDRQNFTMAFARLKYSF